MINTWNESYLHEELKDIYSGQKGEKEVSVDGYICDAVREDGCIVEIQTAQLGKLKTKLGALLEKHRVMIVYPVAKNTLIETFSADNTLISRRKSPKHETLYQLFREMTGIYSFIGNPRLTVLVITADLVETRIADGKGSWRRKGISKDNKKLIKIHDTREFRTLDDYRSLIPGNLPEDFTVSDLKFRGAGVHAGHMAWVLRKTGILELTGKKGNAYLYRLSSGSGQNR
jgi:hypothetical protein